MTFHQSFTRTRLVSSVRLLVCGVVISTLLLLDTTSAQFTQTYGWGGAGMGGYGGNVNGKRSYDRNTITASSSTLHHRKCLPNKKLQHYIFELIQGELTRIRSCREVEMIRQEAEDFTNVFSDIVQ